MIEFRKTTNLAVDAMFGFWNFWCPLACGFMAGYTLNTAKPVPALIWIFAAGINQALSRMAIEGKWQNRLRDLGEKVPEHAFALASKIFEGYREATGVSVKIQLIRGEEKEVVSPEIDPKWTN
jgi:hypothetical protein